MTYTVATIIGTRPQFIKEAPMSMALRKNFNELIIHTGQHYDENMSYVFFEDMEIPQPDYNLNIGSGLHGEQTGRMLAAIEEVLIKEKPDYVLVYGDTNSTLAGALAAVKLQIPVGHIEAGLRSFNRNMPEEINRIATDRIADHLFCPSKHAVSLLKNEGIEKNVFLTGDVMYDACLHFLPIAEKKSTILESLGLTHEQYLLLTIHRPSNTDDTHAFMSIMKGIADSPWPIVFPRHPRTKKVIQNTAVQKMLSEMPHLKIIESVGFLDMLYLEHHARKILTDSGGVQKEAYFLGKPCITLRTETEWVETVKAGYNVITDNDPEKIRQAIHVFDPTHPQENFYGDGNAAEKITESIKKAFNL
ncbi:MAG: UDP-N-acetylglucosamine 2-epimerase (non-hydrolyzing) [Candidatus Marinimicrobia bacterium]|nr:UDP-N-acetylglucosamine 2-epimerase (non-hydrolyzing) [Candidatus Neomarinimicrobiota bacterium]MDD5582454.1 UDP-N-acetylglucosamine 2-epimerase (non-hydrolyzing) [Candidatus Neomarinimicrobiota bacterium]